MFITINKKLNFMKKLFFSVALLATFTMTAQTMAYTAVEFKAKKFTQDNILKAFDKVYEDVKINQGGIVLERIWLGGTKGMTHRIVWMSTLGIDMVDEGAINP